MADDLHPYKNVTLKKATYRNSLPQVDAALCNELDAIFHKPFSPEADTAWNGKEKFAVASVADHYSHQSSLARAITQAAKNDKFGTLLLVSGDINTGMLPIGVVHAMRLNSPQKLDFMFARKTILVPRSVHTGTDCTMTRDYALTRTPENEAGDKRVLFFARGWHAPRVYLTALKQTPEIKPVMALCDYANVGAKDQDWRGNTQYMAWMWSELQRLSAPNATSMMAPISTLTKNPDHTQDYLANLGSRLKSHLTQQGVDPETIARGAPQNTTQADAPHIKREPDSALLVYPKRVEAKFGNPLLQPKPSGT